MATKAIVNTDQEMNDGMAEIELQRLQRQYRIMEGDRKAYSEESRILLGKQRNTVDKLKKENEYLQDELRLLEQRNEDRKKNGIQSKKAETMAETADTLQRKMKAILVQIQSLDEQIAQINSHVDSQRSKLGGVNAARQNSDAIDKQVRVLENRLDKALVKFNKALAVNKRLRVIIDNLRRERLVFDNVYHKYERELMEQKKTMADIIEASNAAYEARDEAQTKIIALREKAEKEYQAYIQEIKEVDRALEHDRKLKEFMATKTMHRQRQPVHRKTGSKKEKEAQSNGNTEEKVTVSLETYEAAFSKIRKVTGISDIGELVERFKAVEDQNFSLFNYVNEVNNEIELLAEEIVEYQRKINQLKIEAVEIEEKRQEEIKELEQELSVCVSKGNECNKQNEDLQLISNELTKAIEALIGSLQTAAKARPKSAPKQQEGEEVSPEAAASAQKRSERLRQLIDFSVPAENLGDDGVNENNLLQFLGLIEQKTNELLTLNHIVNSPKKAIQLVDNGDFVSTAGVTGLLGQGPAAPIGNLSINAPSTGDDHDSEDNGSDEDDRPLTREEIRQRTLRGLNKRERTANAGNKAAVQKQKRKNGKKEYRE
ncbi:hypothetical protein EDD86DRAFT_199272 [Gorgonomyces haynaldii]|nr:hypothetical protein EDD86DRAFT_199272 [Gorgonomyces haynaldii]